MTVRIDALTRDLVPQQPVTWQKLDLKPLFDVPGSFTLILPATARNWDLITFDSQGEFIPVALLVDWNGVYSTVLLAESWEYDLIVDPNTGLLFETITLAGSDMLALLANRVLFVNGTLDWSAQPVTPRVLTGPAETVIKTAITENTITAGNTYRQIPGFTVATDLGRGGTVTYTVTPPLPATQDTGTHGANLGRNLMELVRTVARASLIGVQVTLSGGQLVFDCYIPRDLSAAAVFSTALGNLRGATVSDATPTADVILTEDGANPPNFVTNPGGGDAPGDPWRVVEYFEDQTSTTDASDIATAVTDDLANGASAHQLDITAVDIPQLMFGRDYNLGDTVTVSLRSGVAYTDIVSGVELIAGSDSTDTAFTTPTTGVQVSGAAYGTYYEQVIPTIGNPAFAKRGVTSAQRLADQVRRIDDALRQARKAGQ